MKEVAELLNSMLDAGVISDYAVFGAVAQMRYTEAVSTMDADILIALPNDEGLDLLSPIYSFCSKCGYEPEGEAILVGDWPVQFIPVFDDLTRKALAVAECGKIDDVPLKVVSAEWLTLMALKTGRAKDYARMLALMESNAVTREKITQMSAENDLAEQWTRFEENFLNE
jgi:hypothetical protein